MVLINDQAVCLVCGTSPSSNGDPPEQEKFHSHSHPHTHTHEHGEHTHEHAHEAKAEPDDITKLRVLIPHWIDHNEEHAASFRRWADKARALKREKTAQRIEEAVKQMAACNQALRDALEGLKGE